MKPSKRIKGYKIGKQTSRIGGTQHYPWSVSGKLRNSNFYGHAESHWKFNAYSSSGRSYIFCGRARSRAR